MYLEQRCSEFRVLLARFFLKKKEDQSVGALVFLRKGNKILMGANMETKCRAE